MVPASPPAFVIAGEAGRSTTRRFLAAIARAHPSIVGAAPAILLSRGDTDEVEPRSWLQVLSGIDPIGVAVVPAGEARMLATARLSAARVVTFGVEDTADVTASEVRLTPHGVEFVVEADSSRHLVSIAMLGEHFVHDATAALAAAWAAGVPLESAVEAVRGTAAGESTMHATERGGALLIDDSVSASPASTVAALKALAILGSQGRRTIAVLGALELPSVEGGFSHALEANREAHDRIGRIVVRLNIRMLVVVGDDARHIHNAAGLEGSWNGESVLVSTTDEAYDLLRGEVDEGDIVLVKCPGAAGHPLVTCLAPRERGSAA